MAIRKVSTFCEPSESGGYPALGSRENEFIIAIVMIADGV